MKKLILLAVVVFGFSAISLAQVVISDGIISGGITPATNPNAGAGMTKVEALRFGAIVSSTQYDGTLLVKANGQIVKTNVTATGPIGPASFSVTGLMSGTPIITISPNHWDWGNGIQLDINKDDPDNLYSTAVAGAGNFTVKIGGLLTIVKNSTGTIAINNFTVTLNNQ